MKYSPIYYHRAILLIINLFSRAKVMSVIDYKYVNSVNVEQSCSESLNLAGETDVRNLKLLVRDERLEGRSA